MAGIDVRYDGVKPENGGGLRYGIIEATSRCQLRCPGCYMVRRGHLNHGEMTLAEAVRVLDLCRDYRGAELETMDILGGEPLLWSSLGEYISVLLERGILPWIFTNMLAVTPDLARWLMVREVHVTGKLNVNPDDATQHSLQAAMIGSSIETAQKLFGAIRVFLDAGYRDPLFRLQNLLRKANVGYVPDYYRWCLRHGIGTDLEMMGSGETVGADYWETAPAPEQIAEMIRQVQAVRAEYGLGPATVLMPHIFGSCPFYDKGLYFDVRGGIRACSNSTVELARVTDPDPIRQAYESPLICNRLRLTQATVGEPCHSCDRWIKCRGGCRATVEGMGNPLGGYTLCPLPYLTT